MSRRIVFGVSDDNGHVWNHTLTTSRYEARMECQRMARCYPNHKPWRVVEFAERQASRRPRARRRG